MNYFFYLNTLFTYMYAYKIWLVYCLPVCIISVLKFPHLELTSGSLIKIPCTSNRNFGERSRALALLNTPLVLYLSTMQYQFDHNLFYLSLKKGMHTQICSEIFFPISSFKMNIQIVCDQISSFDADHHKRPKHCNDPGPCEILRSADTSGIGISSFTFYTSQGRHIFCMCFEKECWSQNQPSHMYQP